MGTKRERSARVNFAPACAMMRGARLAVGRADGPYLWAIEEDRG